MEVCCGRKNMDLSQLEEDMHLLSLFKRKAEEGQLLDMVDKSSEDMQLYGAKIVNMLRVAAWCNSKQCYITQYFLIRCEY